MVARPRFDFVGSLELCRELVKLADDLEKGGSTRKTSRDIAVAASSFQGPYGDDHRSRAEGEDLVTAAVVEALDTCAKDWAKAWKNAADQMNAYAEYLAQQECDSMYEARYTSWRYSGYTNWDTGITEYASPPPSKGTVTPPRPAPTPVGKAYDPESAFAKYYPSGPNMYCSYVDSPPV